MKLWVYLQNLLAEPSWTKEETDHLMDLCKRFDMRFTIVADRFAEGQHQVQMVSLVDDPLPKICSELKERSIEVLKERYYSICNRLTKVQQVIFSGCLQHCLVCSGPAPRGG